MVLGADGVQIGSRFVASEEASYHINFKNVIINSADGDNMLTLKELVRVRMMKNHFYEQILKAQQNLAGAEELKIFWEQAEQKKECFLEIWMKEDWK